ncbi:MAG: right-handed parallel beta-helix repeat-containing protein [Gemmatimonadales bacterium]
MRTITGSLFALSLLTACATGHDTTAPAANEPLSGLAGSAAITSAACGDVIVSDLRLENDLSCPGDALTVAGSAIKINLNGHTIAGAGGGMGIRVNTSQDVAIFGGTVRGFLRGIYVVGSTGIVIKDNLFTQNGTGVLLEASSGNTIKSNEARQNSARAFMIRPNLARTVVSTNNDVVENLLIDNPTGIFIISQPGNTLKSNIISGSSVAAIDLPAPGASGNLIKDNLLTAGGAGIRFAAGWTGNTILGNTISANVCGIQGPSAGNTLQGNTLTGNTTDFCP